MNCEQKMIRKEVIVVCLKVLYCYLPGMIENITRNVTSVEIWTKYSN